jgi:hypothetical protein
VENSKKNSREGGFIMLLLTLTLILLVLFVLYKFKYSARDAAFKTFPRLGGNFFLQSLPDLFSLTPENITDKLLKWHDDLGEVFLITKHILDKGVIYVSDSAIAEQISFLLPSRTVASPYIQLIPWIGSDAGYIFSEDSSKMKQLINILMFFMTREKLYEVR